MESAMKTGIKEVHGFTTYGVIPENQMEHQMEDSPKP